MTRLIAKGSNYFDNPKYPIAVRSVKTSDKQSASHEHDLTEIEHAHDFCELTLVTKGRALHWLEGDEFPITAGDAFILQYQQSHYFHQREDLEMINIMYDPKQLELPENRLRKMPGYCAIFLLEPLFRKQHRFTSRLHLNRMELSQAERMAQRMHKEDTEKPDGFEVALLSGLLDLMVFLSRLYEKTDSTNAHALLRVGNVIGAIENDFSQEWAIEDFSKISGMSRSNLMRVFKKATGQAPIEYLTQQRLQKAMHLLRSTRMSVSQIGFEVGFNDSNYFSRHFKKHQGTTPISYRNSHSEL